MRISLLPAYCKDKMSNNNVYKSKKLIAVYSYGADVVSFSAKQEDKISVIRALVEKDNQISAKNKNLLLEKFKSENCTEEIAEFLYKISKDKMIPDNVLSLAYNKIEDDFSLGLAKLLLNKKDFPREIFGNYIKAGCQNQRLKACSKESINLFTRLYKHCLKDPEQHGYYGFDIILNGGQQISGLPKESLIADFCENSAKIIELCSLGDFEFCTKIFEKSNKKDLYFQMLERIWYNSDNFELLKNALTCKNVDGSKLKQNQKIDVLESIYTYISLNANFNNFSNMVKSGVIDFEKINKDILLNVFKNYGVTETQITSIPDEKNNTWDLKYINKIPISFNPRDFIFREFLTMVNDKRSFKEVISCDENINGVMNNQTRIEFDVMGLDYDKWFNPSSKNNVIVKFKDDNATMLELSLKQLNQNIEQLRNISLKSYIDRRYKKFLVNDEFVIPKVYSTNPKMAQKFITDFNWQMKPVWDRAIKNAESDDIDVSLRAIDTLNVKNNVEKLLVLLFQNPQDYKKVEDVDLTIKMWDRIPQKDLFQGNYSTCCIGLGEDNADAMLAYLANGAFNMIELVDNSSGKTIGNALCYYVHDGEDVSFIIDNIEINNAYDMSIEARRKMLDGIIQYAKNLNKDVAKDEDLPIYLGITNNDVPIDKLYMEKKKVGLLGYFTDLVYSDVFEGWRGREVRDLTNVSLYHLNSADVFL